MGGPDHGSTPEFSFPVGVAQLPPQGRAYKIVAKAADRARVAERLGLRDLPRLEVDMIVAPAGADVRVTGTLSADVVQDCVVTLEPVAGKIHETFSVLYSQHPDEPPEDLDLAAAEEAPELLLGEDIDLGEVAVEQLALLIDPYPRLPGAVFKGPVEGPAVPPEAKVSPFAILAKLKKGS